MPGRLRALASADALPFRDGTFDVAYPFSVIACLRRREGHLGDSQGVHKVPRDATEGLHGSRDEGLEGVG